ncbi:hypothetical protein ACQP1P_32385 [Dactylosporangium sp. CA-052675]|uniref:hypothetical protein n=1 Tax=Dactylosporangium sp. CA-052675 TaxID=3239927 RepID=UPI003D931DA0
MRLARLLALSVVAALGPAPAHAAAAVPEPDSAAPVVESFAIERAVIHADTGGATAWMTAHVVDPGSGTATVSAYITRDLGGGGTVRYAGTLTAQSGAPHDGVYRGALTVPLHASAGVFAVHVVTADQAGNRLDRALDRSIPITATHGDGEPAEATGLDVGPAAAVGGRPVTVRAHIADRGQGGVVEAVASLVWSGGGSGIASARYTAPLTTTAGDDYTAAIEFPSFAPNGAYELRIRTLDGAGNTIEQSYGNPVTLRGGSDPSDFAQLYVYDAPNVTVTPDGAVVEVRTAVTAELGGGYPTAEVTHTNPDGSTARYTATSTPAGPTLVARIAVPPRAARGRYRIDVQLVDSWGITQSRTLGDRLLVGPPADAVAPPVHRPGDLTVDAAGAAGTRVAFTTSAACIPASGSVFPIGTTTVTCRTASTTHSFRVTVEDRRLRPAR